MESLIEPGMGIERTVFGMGVSSQEVKCVHPYGGFLTICTYNNSPSNMWPILTSVEVGDEASALEIQRAVSEYQGVSEYLRLFMRPSLFRIRELQDIAFYSIARISPLFDHEQYLLNNRGIIDGVLSNRT